ncbi:unnamed protein product [Nesidiocoris tenuis]|uniref:C2H2-type domain-containing protein n=1 Tax=Nesidiocoris tenuis TaxID=355587 RepID=A0A6H5GX28_9HEMI|nr:unnamed protein product [Nesidiocoris tenuis]
MLFAMPVPVAFTSQVRRTQTPAPAPVHEESHPQQLQCSTNHRQFSLNNPPRDVMFWILKKSRLTHSAVSFFNSINNNVANAEENLTCNVCDRFFCSQGQLSAHQQKKRHFGCTSCDSLFPSLMALEHHKEEFEHWSGSEGGPHSAEESDRDPSTHEMERLL